MNRYNSSPIVSVIVPVYNAELHLNECVESICNQSYSNIEIILVDDGSTDSSGKLCDEWVGKDHRIEVIHNPNGGVSSARNAGISIARGRYVTFCDSDDYLEPDYLDTLIAAAQNNPDHGHIWCVFQTVSGYNKESPIPCMIDDRSELFYDKNEYMTLHELWLDCSPCNKLYKREIIEKNHVVFDEFLSLGEDMLFNLAYMDASDNDKIMVITRPLYNYVRSDDGSLDTKYRADLLDIYRKLNSECCHYYKKWNLPQDQMQKFYNSRFYMYEKVFRNTMRAPNKHFWQKVKENNVFIRGEEFQRVLEATDVYIHPIYLSAYRSGRYFRVIVMDKLVKLKNKISRLF